MAQLPGHRYETNLNAVEDEGLSMTELAKGPNATKADKNPRGGLSAAGRKKFGVQKGVTNYSGASRKDKGRWVSWALRFTGSPKPVKDANGKPTRYALMFRAWGEPVPASREAVQAVHAKAMKRSQELKNADKADLASALAASFDSVECDDCDGSRVFLTDESFWTHVETVHLDLVEDLDPVELSAENVPTNPKLYAQVKAAAKKKFKVFPSAYSSAWMVQEYKRRGGKYKTADAAEQEQAEWEVAAQDQVEEAAEGGLTQWFNEKWVDISRPKAGGGFETCGRPTEGMTASEYRSKYPKCVPASKAKSMTPAQRKSAISRKRASGKPSGGKPNPVATDKSQEISMTDLAHSGSTLVPCQDPECTRSFLDVSAMQDHAEAVHTFNDIEQLVREAVREKFYKQGDYRATPPVPGVWAYVRDMATDWVVFDVETDGDTSMMKASYTLLDGVVTLGQEFEVVRKTVYEPKKKTEES